MTFSLLDIRFLNGYYYKFNNGTYLDDKLSNFKR